MRLSDFPYSRGANAPAVFLEGEDHPMNYHPYSKIWPLMSDKDFEGLKADIKANGLRLDIVAYQGMVLDGRNRERACDEAGVPARYVDANVQNNDEALDLVVSLNTHRRHLSVAQRAFAAARLANIKNGGDRKSIKFADAKLISETERKVGFARAKSTSETTTMKQASDKIGVSYGSAVRAKTVLAKGTDADVREVVDGKTTLTRKAESLVNRTPRVSKTTPTKSSRPRKDERAQRSGDGRVLRLYNAPPLKSLTREQIDPEFTGTPMDWVDKYGHVQTMTAEQYAAQRFGDWVCNARALVRRWRELPELGRDVDHNWLRSPSPRDVTSLSESLTFLRPKIAELEALLACATAALEKKQTAASRQGLRQPACG